MTVPSLDTMREVLTRPYQRGLEALTLGFGTTDASGVTQIAPYDLLDYQRRYGRVPDAPRYLLVPRFPVAEPLVVSVWFRREAGEAEQRTTVELPAGAFPDVSWPIPVGEPAGPGLRLSRFQPLPDPPTGPAESAWSIVALFGNLAKLLWVLGWEYDHLAAHAAQVRDQRTRTRSFGASLDLLGRDLGVPRFPPAAYSFDRDTIALWHLDDEPDPGKAEVEEVFDERERYQPGTGHPALNVGGLARSRRIGRFKSSFEFPAGVAAALRVDHHADFEVPATAALTVEALVRPDPAAGGTAATVVAKREVINGPAHAGWSLAVGTFRGIAANPRFSVSDGDADHNTDLFADVSVTDGAFHHLAGVVERRGPGAMVRLYVDGKPRAERRLAALGALTDDQQPLLVGQGREDPGSGAALTDAQYAGLIDEVRVSSVARPSFHPVAGEGDVEYRERLKLFERWLLPTPGALLQTLNELVQIDRTAESFQLVEDDNDLAVASRRLRVLPRPLPRGSCIGADGDQRPDEHGTVGGPEDEPDFDPAWLVGNADPRIDDGGDAQHRRMQQVVVRVLGRLLDRVGGPLRVHLAYDPAGAGLHRVGRALVVSHALGAGELAAAAHAAGFDLACHTVDGRVRLAQGRGEALAITAALAGPPPPGADVTEGGELVLGVEPAPPPDAEVRWSLVRCDNGDGRFLDAAGAPVTTTAGATARLRALAAGDLSVHVEAVRERHTAAGTRLLRIGLPEAGAGALSKAGDTITRAGLRGATEADGSGGPAAFFHPAYLADHRSRLVDYGPGGPRHRMQRSVAAALDRLLAILGAGILRVERAYDPTGPGLHQEGRALELRHANLDALAARAFAAGFDFVARQATTVHVSCRAGELIAIDAPAELSVGASAACAVTPQARPSACCFSPGGERAFVAEEGTGLLTALDVAAQDGALPGAAVSGTAVVGHRPGAVLAATTPAGARIYVACAGDNAVSVLDPGTLNPVATIPTGREPAALAVRPDGRWLFVACAGDDTVQVYDTGSNARAVAPVAVAGVPTALAATSGNADRVWVAARDAQTLVALDAATAAPAGAPLPLPGHPTGLAVAAGRLWVALADEDRVAVVDLATSTVVQTLAVAGGPRAVAATADGSQIWCACRDSGQVRVIDTASTNLLPAIVSLGDEPAGLAASPAAATYRATLLAVARGSGDATLLDPDSLGTPRSPVAFTVQLGAGVGERLSWSDLPLPHGRVELDSTLDPVVTATGVEAGELLLRALYTHPGRTNPYEFALKLVPALDTAATVIRKDQYDLIMNVLHSFTPIGVEVRTDNIRAHVLEIREGLLDAFPRYTFPAFRVGVPFPPAGPAAERN